MSIRARTVLLRSYPDPRPCMSMSVIIDKSSRFVICCGIGQCNALTHDQRIEYSKAVAGIGQLTELRVSGYKSIIKFDVSP